MKENVKDVLYAAIENPYLWRNVLAIIGMASLLLPWVKLDGASSAMSGADIIAYLFTGAERWEMLKSSPLGALAFLLVPPVTLVLTLLVFTRNIRGLDSTVLSMVSGLAPVPMVVFSGSTVSSDSTVSGGLMAPQVGMVILFLSQLGIITVGRVPWGRLLRGGLSRGNGLGGAVARRRDHARGSRETSRRAQDADRNPVVSETRDSTSSRGGDMAEKGRASIFPQGSRNGSKGAVSGSPHPRRNQRRSGL